MRVNKSAQRGNMDVGNMKTQLDDVIFGGKISTGGSSRAIPFEIPTVRMETKNM